MKLNFKSIGKNLLVSAILVGIFTALDWLFHYFVEGFGVPHSYFYNKLWIGFVLFFVILTIVDNLKRSWLKALIVALFVTLPLQLRYIFIYDALWNITIVLLHFVIIYIVAFAYFKIGEKL